MNHPYLAWYGYRVTMWLFVIVLGLAVYRATRLVTRDQFPLIAEPRDRFAERWGVYVDATDKKTSINGKRTNVLMRSLAYLIECDWCVGVWMSALLTYASWAQPWTPLHNEHWYTAVLIGLTAAAGTGLLAELEPSKD